MDRSRAPFQVLVAGMAVCAKHKAGAIPIPLCCPTCKTITAKLHPGDKCSYDPYVDLEYDDNDEDNPKFYCPACPAVPPLKRLKPLLHRSGSALRRWIKSERQKAKP
jgi:hypothetical protein